MKRTRFTCLALTILASSLFVTTLNVKAETSQKIEILNVEKSKVEDELSELINQSSQTANELDQTEKRIKELQDELAQRKENADKNLRSMQIEMANQNIINSILNASSLSEMIAFVQASNTMISAKQDAMTEVRKLQTELNDKQSKLKELTQSLEGDISELEKKQSEIDNELSSLKQKEADEKEKARLKELESQKTTVQVVKQAVAPQSAPSQARPGHKSFGPHEALAAFDTITAEYGISPGDKALWADIIRRESTWNVRATNPGSGAYGLPQALPASKLASAGSDWQTNPYTQLKWMYDYMVGRYGSISGAMQFWLANSWY